MARKHKPNLKITPGENTQPAQLSADLRQLEALRLRLEEKLSLPKIAERLEYASASAAKAAIAAAMRKVGILPTQEAIAAELADLQAMREALFPTAAKGNIQDIQVYIKLMERQSALEGLDAPKRLANADGSNLPTQVLFYLPDNGRGDAGVPDAQPATGDQAAAGEAGAVPQ